MCKNKIYAIFRSLFSQRISFEMCSVLNKITLKKVMRIISKQLLPDTKHIETIKIYLTVCVLNSVFLSGQPCSDWTERA